MKFINTIINTITLTVLSCSILMAQEVNLPLTSLGLGEYNTPTHVAQIGMGGMHSTYSNAHYYNISNPASLASLRYTSLSIAGYSNSNTFTSGDKSETQLGGQLSYIHIAFPLQNNFNESYREIPSLIRVGAAFSLQPILTTKYNILQITEEPIFNTTQSTGRGESYLANMSVGASYKNLSLGVDAGLFFGSSTQVTQLALNRETADFITRVQDNSSVVAFNYKLGAQYDYFLGAKSSDKKITLGATFSGARNVTVQSDYLETTFRLGPQGAEMLDTLNSNSDSKNQFDLPLSYSFGLSYSNGKNWLIGIDYNAQLWTSGNIDYVGNNKITNGNRISLGTEITPNKNSYNSYFEKIRYRAGIFTSKDYRLASGNEILHQGVTLGFGFPILLPRQKTSFVDFGFELGNYTIKNTDQLKNTYFKINLGFTINDNTWFYKQKYQ